MALKILQVVATAAVVVIVLLLIPVLLRLRRTMSEVSHIVSESRPQTIALLKKAQTTLDSVNTELENIEEITRGTLVIIDKVGEASDALDRAVRSPLTKAGLVTAGAAAASVTVKRRLSRKFSGRE